MGVLSKGTDFTNGDQVTDVTLDNLVDNATFTASAVDSISTDIGGSGSIIVRDLGITTGKLANSTGAGDGVTTVKIATAAVTEAKLGTGAVTAAKIGTNAVTTVKLQDLAVTTDKLASASVTAIKIAPGALNGTTITSTGSTTSRTLANRFADVVNVKDFGAVGDGVTDDTVAIQLAIDSTLDGNLLIPAGTYNVGDITLLLKGDGDTGGFKIEASGVIFTGGGNIILDSCKRVQINGIDAQSHNLVWRGQWWGNYTNCQFLSLIIGDSVGASFSSNYWTDFNQCLLQKVVHSSGATSACNEISFYSCSLRGDAGQGYVGTADYAFEFNSNQNCQGWKFVGGDVSYQNIAIYSVGAGNTTGDIELTFDGTYFDTLVPQPLARADGRIRTINCHHANASVFAGTFSAVTCGSTDLFRGDRAFKFDGTTAMNLIPNGDFSDILTTWTGTGLPVGADGGSTVTPMSGGFSGTYLNINQPNTASNAVYFRGKALPTSGKLTGVIILKNADAGSKVIDLSFLSLASPEVTITDSEWTYVTCSPTAINAAGSVLNLAVFTNDGTAFNVDVAYVGLFYGEGHEALIPSTGFRTIDYSQVYDFPSIAAGVSAFTDFSIPGVTLGDFVLVGKSSAILGLLMTASVNTTGTVRLTLFNPTGSAVDLGNATWYVRVWKRLYV
jgi:hypothetical protein